MKRNLSLLIALCFLVNFQSFSQTTFSEEIKIKPKIGGITGIAEALNNDIITFINTDSGLYISRVSNTTAIRQEKLCGSKISGISAICSTPDNGFACFGKMYNDLAGKSQLSLLKFDSSCNIKWSRNLELAYDDFEIEPAQLKLDAQNNYLGTYTKQSRDYPFRVAMRLLKFNDEGDIVFQTGFNRIYSDGYQSFRLIDVIETYDKGYLFAMTYQNALFGTATGYLLLTDSLGNQLSYKSFGPDYFTWDDTDAPAALFKKDGKYYVLGFYDHWTGDEYAEYYYISSFDKNLSVIGNGKLIPYNMFSLQHYINQNNIPVHYVDKYIIKKSSVTSLEYIDQQYNGTYVFNLNRYNAEGKICPDYNSPVYDYSISEKTISFGNEITGPVKSKDYITITRNKPFSKNIHLMKLICSGDASSFGEANKSQKATSSTLASILFPNPAHNTITISIPLQKNQQLQLYNAEGKLLQSTQVNNYQITLNISSYKNGFYIIKIVGSDQTQILKFIKQ